MIYEQLEKVMLAGSDAQRLRNENEKSIQVINEIRNLINRNTSNDLT